MAPSDSDIDWDQLQDRSVIITGGASGLGAATAMKFIQHGAYVTIADMSETEGLQFSEQLGDRASFVKCNTADWNSSAAAFKHAANFAPSKTLDVVVLFAGVGGENKSLVDIVLEEEPIPSLDSPIPAEPGHRAIDINLTGV